MLEKKKRKSCWFFGYFVFFPIVVVTVHGEVRAEHVCGLCRLLGPLSATVMDSVLKSSVQIHVASLLVFVDGELLPFQAFPLPKHHPSCAVCGQVEGQCSGKGASSTWCFHAEMDCLGDEGIVGPVSAHVAVFSNLPEVKI